MIKLNNVEISQEDLIKEITGNKELMDTLQAKFRKKESGWFVPKLLETYWYLESNGVSCFNNNSEVDKAIMERQQVFCIREEAEKADQQRMAKVRILKRIAEENAKEGWVCDWNDEEQYKYIFGLDYGIKKLVTGDYNYWQIQETGFYMSETVAEKLEKELLEDYKIYLGKK